MNKVICDVVIIDSGLSKELFDKCCDQICGSKVFSPTSSSIVDHAGHGSGVFWKIYNSNPTKRYFIIKVFDSELSTDIEYLIHALEYVRDRITCKILHMSLGITKCNYLENLEKVCKEIYSKGTIIISAFDNAGALSYPAAFDFVIGVDASDKCTSINQIVVENNGIVDVFAFGGIQRVAWSAGLPLAFVRGSSFAAANVTSMLLHKDNIDNIVSKQEALSLLAGTSFVEVNGQLRYIQQQLFHIHKAIAIPFNKEISSLVNYSDLLGFELIDIFDIKFRGEINKIAKSIYGNHEFTIKNIESINWDNDFDTVIIGHLEHLEHITNKCIKSFLFEKCIENNKQVYSFDPPPQEYANLNSVFHPHVQKNKLAHNYGKLQLISSPILGVFGTSSHQGKYTLQLYFRKKFIESGYKICQMGTEPSALLFGMNSVFPIGYNSSVNLNFREAIIYLNQQMAQMDKMNPDIILVGSQSNTALYWPGNISQYPTAQIELIYGTLPDASILCVNSYDDLAYVEKNINLIETLSGGAVIALAVFPFSTTKSSYIFKKAKILDADQIKKAINSFKNKFGRQVGVIGDTASMDNLFDYCVNWFNKNG